MSAYAQKGNRDVWGQTIVLAKKRGLWKRLRGKEKGLRENQAAVLVQRRFRLKIKARIAARKVEERKKEIERLEHEARIRTRAYWKAKNEEQFNRVRHKDLVYACEALNLDATGKKAKLIATLHAWIMQPEIEARLAAERAERERQHRIDSRAIVWTCGHGPYGQLGQGEGVTRLDAPARIRSLRERNVREVFTGLEADVVFAKDADENILAWGGGNSCADLIRGAIRERVKASFQLEKDLAEDPSWLERQKVATYWDPIDLRALTKLGKTDAGAEEKVVCVNVTRSHAVATTTSGDMWTWGKNTKGQLGLTKDLTRNQFIPEFCDDFAEDFDKIVKRSLAVGRNHAAVVLADTRSLLTWGATTCGQLGTNDNNLAAIGTPETRRREARTTTNNDPNPTSCADPILPPPFAIADASSSSSLLLLLFRPSASGGSSAKGAGSTRTRAC